MGKGILPVMPVACLLSVVLAVSVDGWGSDAVGSSSPADDHSDEVRQERWRERVLEDLLERDRVHQIAESGFLRHASDEPVMTGCRRRIYASRADERWSLSVAREISAKGVAVPPPRSQRSHGDQARAERCFGDIIDVHSPGEEPYELSCTWSIDGPAGRYQLTCKVETPEGTSEGTAGRWIDLERMTGRGLEGGESSGRVSCSEEGGGVDSPEGVFHSVVIADNGQGAHLSGPEKRVNTNRTCALREDGALVCWSQCYGELTTVDPGPLLSFDMGPEWMCGVQETGELACWDTTGFEVQIPPTGQFTAVDVGVGYACALSESGAVVCWSPGRQESPAKREGPYSEVRVGRDYACTLDPDGRVDCWEPRDMVDYIRSVVPFPDEPNAQQHELIDQLETAARMSGKPRPEGTFETIEVSGKAACGVHRDGHVLCWSPSGWIDDPGRPGHPSSQVARPTFDAISVGGRSPCGLQPDGTLWCWGISEDRGRSITLRRLTRLARGSAYPGCGIDESGLVVCWGCDHHADRDGTSCESRCLPPNGAFRDVYVGLEHSCGITVDGAVRCWGYVGEAGIHDGPPFRSRVGVEWCR